MRDVLLAVAGRTVFSLEELELRVGELLHLTGENGAGKTTLLRALAGELPYQGHIRVEGHPPGSLPARAATAFVPTEPSLLDDLTVGENFTFMAAAWQRPSATIFQLAGDFGLAPWLDAWPMSLSRGTRQKVALSINLGLGLPLTLLDEPFGTLDTRSRDVLLKAIEHRVQAGGSVLITTHGPELARVPRRTLAIHDGVLVMASGVRAMNDVMWSLRRLTLRRSFQRLWQSWKASGLLAMGLYLSIALLVGLVSLWQTYRFPLAAPDSTVVGGLSAIWWLSAGLAQRPALGLSSSEALLLRAPIAPWKVWLGPLAFRCGRTFIQGVALGLLLWAWFPTWWAEALSLPLLLAGRPLAHLLWYDARVTGNRYTQIWVFFISLLPLMSAVHPLLLPVSMLLGSAGLMRVWRHFWKEAVPPQLVLHAQVEELRRGAKRLGLPVPEVQPNGVPAPRRWFIPLRGTGAFQASLWRGGLHLTRRPAVLLFVLPIGLMVSVLSPIGVSLIDPMLSRAMPYLFGQVLAPILIVLGPIAPVNLPLLPWQRRLAQVLPGTVVLGSLLSVGALGAVAFGWGPASIVGAALLMPWVALTLLAWLGPAGPASLSNNVTLRYAAATAPALLTTLCGGILGGWLAPVALLLVGTLVLLLPGQPS